MHLDPDQCYAAVRSRDPRFDGRFFTGVLSTGIFCRPICPARTPRRDRVQFFPSAAAALHAGFRPCRRCRPDTAASWGEVAGSEHLVRRAVDLIDGGGLDDGNTLDDLATRLAVSPRHLRRLFHEHVGSTPHEVAVTRRVLLAHELLLDTTLPIASVAFAAGFGSIRQFNAAFQERLASTPSEVRRGRKNSSSQHQRGMTESGDGGASIRIPLRLGVRAPWKPASLVRFLAARAVPGLESVADGIYTRQLGRGTVEVNLSSDPVTGSIVSPDPTRLPSQRAAMRRLIDADADLTAIEQHLSRAHPSLARLVLEQSGLRVPGAWDTWETTVRVVVGQQVSVKAATTLAAQLVRPDGGFAGPEEIAAGEIVDRLGMPAARKRALRALGRAVATGELDLDGPLATVRASLAELPGVGPWTVEMVAMRALRDTDAFPSSDLGVRRAVAALGLSPEDIERTRPFRSYLTVHLWETLT